MFRHQGNNRTLKHNLRIASLLSFVAGIVNVAGFLSVQQLTTNVTGHFAYFVDEVFKLNFWKGLTYFFYIFFFFLGSFTSSFLVEFNLGKNGNYAYVFPAIIESSIIFSLGVFGNFFIANHPEVITFCLLFAMGLQNSLVTKISGSTVRTTHLTGLFTDLGIETSQLFFYKNSEQKAQLFSSIKLRLTIISFFFMGGIIGGVFYSSLGLYLLTIAGSILVLGVLFDNMPIKFKIINS